LNDNFNERLRRHNCSSPEQFRLKRPLSLINFPKYRKRDLDIPLIREYRRQSEIEGQDDDVRQHKYMSESE